MNRSTRRGIRTARLVGRRLLGGMLPVAVMLCGLMFSATSDAQDDWNVMRVEISSDLDEILKLVKGSDYEIIEIDRLNELLQSESQRRSSVLFELPRLEEAVYVGRLEADSIVSEQSRWTFDGKALSAPFGLGDISMATSRAKGVLPEADQLLDHQQFNASGDLELPLPGKRVHRWFGFSVRRQQENGVTFRFRCPIATSAQMLIETSQSERLISNDVVIEPVADPMDYLPEDWPNVGYAFTGSVGRQWWLVHLSGVSRFNISVEDVATAQQWYKHVLRDAEVDYFVGRNRIDVQARFNVAEESGKTPVRLQVANRLTISSVLVGGSSATWRIEPSLSGDFNLLEFTGPDANGQSNNVSGRWIEIRASMPTDERDGQTETLPLANVAVAESYAVRGKTRVFSRTPSLVHRLQSSDALVSTSQQETTNEEQVQPSTWIADWVGVNPRLSIDVGREDSKWTARSFTRFSVQEDWLSANCRIRLDATEANSNELRMVVGTGWFVDKVKLVDAESGDLRARFVERGVAQQAETEIVVDWEEQRSPISIELDVLAHRPQKTDTERIQLFTRRLLTIADADQIDNYVIEPSGRYQVEFGANLLRFQLQPNELPEWQQQLLPEASKRWIFRGIRRQIPPIDLKATRGTYSARTIAVVTPTTTGSSSVGPTPSAILNLAVEITPEEGHVDAVEMELPNDVAELFQRWTLSTTGSVQRDLSSEMLEADVLSVDDQETRIEIALREPTTSPFVLHAVVPVSASAETSPRMTIPGLLRASSCESQIAVPRDLVRYDEFGDVELLPAASCCDDLQGLENLDLERSALNGYIVARREGKTLFDARLRNADSKIRSPGWIWNEEVEHWIDGKQQRHHQVTWNVESGSDGDFRFVLPDGWWIDLIEINGKVVRIPPDADSRERVLQLPPNQLSELEMSCSSLSSSGSWLSHEKVASPSVELEIVKSSHHLLIPPSKLALRSAQVVSDGSRLRDRLIPRGWWQWLAPGLDRADTASGETAGGWTTVEISQSGSRGGQGGRTPGKSGEVFSIYVAERTAVAGLSLAFVVLLFAAFWFVIGRSVRKGWVWVGGLAVLLLLAPASWVGWLQLILLACLVTVLLRMAQVVIGDGSQRTPLRSGTQSRASLSKITAGWLIILCCGSDALGQGYVSEPDEESNRSVYGILIPTLEDGEIAGDYAYIPARLRALLENQGSTTARSIGGRILGASYNLRTNSTQTVDRDYIQELTAELRIRITQMDGEFRLPFISSEMPLVRTEINGQSDFFGDISVVQEERFIAIQTRLPGTYLVKLYFSPSIELDDVGQARLQAQIPSVASSELRIVTDGGTRMKVNSIGRQVENGNELVVALGPTDELDCSWLSNDANSVAPQMVGTHSRLWMKAFGSQVTAAAVIEIQNPDALPEEFHLVADDSWEPIGSQWGDVEMVSSTVRTISSRRIYRVRLRRGQLYQGADEAVVRMLLAPRSSSGTASLPLPFVTLQEASQTGVRTFRWSSDDESAWVPEGVRIWPEATSEDLDVWGDLLLSDESRAFRVTPGTVASNLQRRARTDTARVTELNVLRLSVGQATIDYRVDWPQVVRRKHALRLALPRLSRVESIAVDGSPTQYQVVRADDGQELLVVKRDHTLPLQSLSLRLSYPIRFRSRATRMSRVVLMDEVADSSVVRILRGGGLECTVSPVADSGGSETAIELEAADVQGIELLEQLEAVVGQVDFEDRYRSSSSLPLEFVVKPPSVPVDIRAHTRVEKTEQGWIANVQAEWGNEHGSLDYLVFDIPSQLRDRVDVGSFPRRLIPMGDPQRVALCVMPVPTAGETTRVDLSFPIATTASSQTLSVPNIQLLDVAPIVPEILLPKQVDGEMVTWEHAGEVVPPGANRPEKEGAGNYVRVDSGGVPLQARWRNVAGGKRAAKVLAENVVVASIEEKASTGYVDYWIDPRNNYEMRFKLPESLTLIGAQVGGRVATWRFAGQRTLVLLAQPNYLPIPVRLLIRWEAGVTQRFEAPVLLDAQPADTGVQVDLIDSNWEVVDGRGGGSLAGAWSNALSAGLGVASGLEISERRGWLSSWNPVDLGLDPNEPLPPSVSIGQAEDETVTVQQFWEHTLMQLEIDSLPLLVAGSDSPEQPIQQSARRRFRVEDARFELRGIEDRRSSASRMVAAGMVGLVMLLLLRLGIQFKSQYLQLLSYHPWIYWLQLALVAWWLLPVAWPALILAVVALLMALGQAFDLRRTSQFR